MDLAAVFAGKSILRSCSKRINNPCAKILEKKKIENKKAKTHLFFSTLGRVQRGCVRFQLNEKGWAFFWDLDCFCAWVFVNF